MAIPHPIHIDLKCDKSNAQIPFCLKIPVNIRVSTSIITALICIAAGIILTDTDAI
jgi:hypothetical protein